MKHSCIETFPAWTVSIQKCSNQIEFLKEGLGGYTRMLVFLLDWFGMARDAWGDWALKKRLPRWISKRKNIMCWAQGLKSDYDQCTNNNYRKTLAFIHLACCTTFRETAHLTYSWLSWEQHGGARGLVVSIAPCLYLWSCWLYPGKICMLLSGQS